MDDEPEWYRRRPVVVGLVVVLVVGAVVGWLLLRGDDDEATTGASTTVTSTPATTVSEAPPSTPEGTEPAPAPEGSPAADLETARSAWSANDGQTYSFSYFAGGSDGEERFCVSGVAGEPDSAVDVTDGCGSGLASGGRAVEAWFDAIGEAIDAGTLLSAEYDPTNGYPVSAELGGADSGFYRLDFLTFAR